MKDKPAKKIRRSLSEAIGIRSVRKSGRGSSTAYTPEQAQAHDLYVAQNKLQKDIAAILGRSQSQISQWVNKFEWDAEREARHLSPITIHTEIMRNNAEIVKQLKTLDWANEPDVAKKSYVVLMDALSKGNAVAGSMMKQYDSLGGILLAMEEFIKWLEANETRKKSHPDLLTILEIYLPGFSRAMAEKYA